MNLDDLRMFAAVARLGSFSGAAAHSGVSRATVSRVVQRLEVAHGAPLLHRTTRRVEVTPAGASLLARISGPLNELSTAMSALRVRPDEPSGTLRVSTTGDIAQALLVPIVASIVERYPRLTIDTIVTLRPVDLIGEQVDAALRAYAGRPGESNLVARRLGEIEFGWFGAPSYLARHGVPGTIEELRRHRLIAARRLTLDATVLVDDPLFGLELTRAGVGLGLVASTLCAQDEASGRLVRILPEVVRPTGQLWLVYPDGARSPNLDAFRGAVVDEVARQQLLVRP